MPSLRLVYVKLDVVGAFPGLENLREVLRPLCKVRQTNLFVVCIAGAATAEFGVTDAFLEEQMPFELRREIG